MRPVARALRLLALFAALVACFLVLLTLAYMIPSGPIHANVAASIPRLRAEGAYPRPFMDSAALQLDNVTDSLMLDVALGDSGLDPFVAAMSMVRGVIPADATSGDPIVLLEDSLTGHRTNQEAYARYWHGYQVALRPALFFFSYEQLRYLNMWGIGLLAVVLIVLTWGRAGPETTVSLVVALGISGFVLVPLSLQYSWITYVAFFGMLAILVHPDEFTTQRGDLEFFLVLGAMASFIDLLTAPLLALGLPLGVALAVRAKSGPECGPKSDVLFGVRNTAAWILGYSGAWISKWIIGTVVLGPAVIRGAEEEARLWTGTMSPTSQVVVALKVNFMNLFPLVRFSPEVSGIARYGPFAAVVAVVVIVIVVMLALFRRPREAVQRASVMLLLIPMPFLWLTILSTHSKLHYAFTYRVQAIAVFAVVYFVAVSVDWTRAKRAIKRW